MSENEQQLGKDEVERIDKLDWPFLISIIVICGILAFVFNAIHGIL
ncbi:MAG: hypothetical protein LBL67_01130 [Coriobacteriales bacterium]|jgi:succinate dehydrogenase/fumarate reductase cytochrome b subunit|nr:hypothetical protein [Coriobacteriales bacterium]